MSVQFQEAVRNFSSQVALQRQLTQAATSPEVTDRATAVFRTLSTDSFDHGSQNRMPEPSLSLPMPDPRPALGGSGNGNDQPISASGMAHHISRILQGVNSALSLNKPPSSSDSDLDVSDPNAADSDGNDDDSISTDGVTVQAQTPVELFRANRAQEANSILMNSAKQGQTLPAGVENMLLSRLTPDQQQAYEQAKAANVNGTSTAQSSVDPQAQARMAQLTLELALSKLDDLFNKQMSVKQNFRAQIQ